MAISIHPDRRFPVHCLWCDEMSDDRIKLDTVSLEEATISNMRKIPAILEVLERKSYNLVRREHRQ